MHYMAVIFSRRYARQPIARRRQSLVVFGAAATLVPNLHNSSSVDRSRRSRLHRLRRRAYVQKGPATASLFRRSPPTEWPANYRPSGERHDGAQRRARFRRVPVGPPALLDVRFAAVQAVAGQAAAVAEAEGPSDRQWRSFRVRNRRKDSDLSSKRHAK